MDKATALAWAILPALAAGGALPPRAEQQSDQAGNWLAGQRARRAARAQAISKLHQRVKGMPVAAGRTVGDFLGDSHPAATAMLAFLCGLKEADVVHADDGTCTVALDLPLADLAAGLAHIRDRYYDGLRFKAEDFQQVVQAGESKVLHEIGRCLALPEEPAAAATFLDEGELESPARMSPAADRLWAERAGPQVRLAAVRAARADAMRRLGRRVEAVRLDARTTLRDLAGGPDQARAGMEAFLPAARESAVRYLDDEPVVQVDVQVRLRSVYAAAKSFLQARRGVAGPGPSKLEDLLLAAEDVVITETGWGVPPNEHLKAAPAGAIERMVREGHIPGWVNLSLRAAGSAGVDETAPDARLARLAALREAELDARVQLFEKLQGLTIVPGTSVRELGARHDDFRAGVLTFLQAARLEDRPDVASREGSVRAAIEIELRPLWDLVVGHRAKLKVPPR